jgi:hypothetical protein
LEWFYLRKRKRKNELLQAQSSPSAACPNALVLVCMDFDGKAVLFQNKLSFRGQQVNFMNVAFKSDEDKAILFKMDEHQRRPKKGFNSHRNVKGLGI